MAEEHIWNIDKTGRGKQITENTIGRTTKINIYRIGINSGTGVKLRENN